MNKTNESLLRTLAARGDMLARDLIVTIPRVHGNYRDFYGLAGLIHDGLIAADTEGDKHNLTLAGSVGADMRDTAAILNQLILPPGETFAFDGYPERESWNDFPMSLFLTSKGLFKIEELNEEIRGRRQKRFDYGFAIFVALLAAIASGVATAYFSGPHV